MTMIGADQKVTEPDRLTQDRRTPAATGAAGNEIGSAVTPSGCGNITPEGARKELQHARDYAQQLIDSIDDPLIVTSPDGLIAAANHSACDRLGYKADELKGEPLEKIMPEGVEELRAITDGSSRPARKRVECALLTRQGKLVPVLLSSSMIRAPEGEITGIVHVAVDLTEQLRAEQARQARDLRLQKHKDALAYLARQKILHSGDLDLAVQSITEIAAVTLSVARTNLWLHDTERFVLECIDCYDLDSGRHTKGQRLDTREFPAYIAALQTERSLTVADTMSDHRTRELEPYLTKHKITSLLDSPIRLEGRIVGVLCIEHIGTPRQWTLEEQSFAGSTADLASLALEAWHRRKAQEQLKAALDMAEAANRAKSSFLANMSHEIRTPLNAVIGYSELLQEEAEELGYGKLIPDLCRIHAAGKHLHALISDVLDLSKIEAGKMPLQLERFDPAGLVAEIAATARPLVEKNRNRLEIRTSSDLGMMTGDQTRLRQVILNLLSNAAKFTDNGLVSFEVVREAAHSCDWVSFTVTDTGIGITEEAIDELFEDFTQVDTSSTRKYGGTGLGLSISRKLCRMMGGEISVQSKPGEGSSFKVRIPAEIKSIAGAEPCDRRSSVSRYGC